MPPAEVIEQPPRRGDEQVEAAAQPAFLRLHADPAEDDGAAEPQIATVLPGRLRDLGGELTRRCDHERARRPARPAAAEALQNRQQEGRRLAGAGLCAGDQILSVQHRRNGAFLDGRGGLVARAIDRAKNFRAQAQVGELHTGYVLQIRAHPGAER